MSMKVLYCNPIFFEYRLPFYKELVRLFDGDFYVMYSPVRYRMCNKERLCTRIKDELRENAIPLNTEHVFDTNSKKWDVMPDIEKGKRIPLTFGLLKKIRKVRPDIIITEGYFQWTPLILLYGALFHVPVYMGYERTLHTERYTGKMKTWQRKLFNKGIHGFLVNGSETRKYLLSLGVPTKRIHIGGMSADAEMLRIKVEMYRKEDLSSLRKDVLGKGVDKGFVFLFVGVIAERKGVGFLLQAWEEHIERHSDDMLVLVGDGNQLNEFRDKYQDVHSVKFMGRVDYEKVPLFYALSDVFVLPTIEDNWSLVVPEAMACGLPVATSIYNGCHPELVQKDINGITFDTLKRETIVAALDYFHHQDLEKMGEASKRLEEPFNTENCARRVYDAIMEDCVCH